MASNALPATRLVPYLEELTDRQRIFVECKLKGMTDVAAATAAGVPNPSQNGFKMKRSKAVQEAIAKGIEIAAQEVMFTRKKAHELLLDAHRNAANTTEQVMAIKELIRLHGVAAPEVKEIHQTIKGHIEHREIRDLTDKELLELAQLPTDRLPAIIDGEFTEVAREDAQGQTGGTQSGEGSAEG